jgi:hypothetical protein
MSAIFYAIYDRISGEPVVTMGLIQAALALAVGFGLHWSAEQVALAVAFSAAFLSFIVRSKVSPA